MICFMFKMSFLVSLEVELVSCNKIVFLSIMCLQILHFEPVEIYRQKLQLSVTDGELSEEDVTALLRLRVLLCIPQEVVDAAHADICGRLFEKVTKLAMLVSELGLSF